MCDGSTHRKDSDMTTTRVTAAILEAIQALDNAGIEYDICTLSSEYEETAAIVIHATWQQLGFTEVNDE